MSHNPSNTSSGFRLLVPGSTSAVSDGEEFLVRHDPHRQVDTKRHRMFAEDAGEQPSIESYTSVNRC